MSAVVMKWIVVATACLVCGNVMAQAQPAKRSAEEIQEILKQRIDVENHSLGMAVGYIDSQGQIVTARGLVRDDGKDKLNGDTVFEIGSISKVFTALLLTDMIRRGDVALTDPASKYLPESVKLPTRNGREITLADLATHTSSLPRMPSNFKPKDPLNPYADYTVEQLYEELSKIQLNRDIGEKYEYSNLGSGLLGHILSLKAGMDYESLVSKRIFKPLCMTSTMITLTPDARKRLTTGHNANLMETSNWDIATISGAGAIRSTVNDMLKFVRAHMGLAKGPLDEAILDQQKVWKPTGSPDLDIGLGWHRLSKNGNQLIWHNGQTGGYHSFIGFDKNRGVGVVVLSNTALSIDDIGLHLLDPNLALKKNTPKKRHVAIKIDPKILDAYVGEYPLSPFFVITVTKEGEKLMVQATNQPKFEVFPESETKFFLKVVDAQISFVKDEKGTVTQLILHQNGLDQPGKKRAKTNQK